LHATNVIFIPNEIAYWARGGEAPALKQTRAIRAGPNGGWENWGGVIWGFIGDKFIGDKLPEF